MQLLTEVSLATMQGPEPYGFVKDAALVLDGARIAFAGRAEDLPPAHTNLPAHPQGGRLVTPGLIDCHTHLIYAGSRAREFELRLNGASYEEIARQGGGIFSTVEATRSASFEDLLESALARVDRMLAEGVTTIEIKSGYGLDVETELRMLQVARAIETHRAVRVRTTFLGAHAIPKDQSAKTYLEDVCFPALRMAAKDGLVDMVDGFCETIAFSTDEMARVFDVAAELGLPVKLHAEQLSALGGSSLAASFGALSADHLEYATDDDVSAMAAAGTVAVLLPGAFYFLRETKLPPISAFRAAGVPMAVATDCNPGSSPMTSVLLAINMAATLFALTPEETLAGVTKHAAGALGLTDTGTIEAGARADLAIWDLTDPAELTYRMGDASLHARIFGGTWC